MDKNGISGYKERERERKENERVIIFLPPPSVPCSEATSKMERIHEPILVDFDSL